MIRYIFFMIFFSSSLMAQENPTNVPTVNPKATYFHQEYNSGAKFTEGYFLNEKKEGHWLSWYPNGNKESDEYFSNGENVGIIYRWYEDGTIRLKIDYSNRTYFLHRIGQMVDQTVEGKFDENENRIGKWVTTSKGWGKHEVLYKAGLKDGPVNSWNEQGDLISTGAYSNGKQTGHWIEWNNYDWRKYLKYQKVKMTGPPKVEEGDYVLGGKNGLWIIYMDSNNQKNEIQYKDGIELSRVAYFYDGKIASKKETVDGKKIRSSWYPNGNMESRKEISSGTKIMTNWYDNGNESSVQVFLTNSNNSLAVSQIANNPNQAQNTSPEIPEKVRADGLEASSRKSPRYDNERENEYLDKADGEWKFWDVNGKLLWAETFKDGVLTKWFIYDEDAKDELEINISSVLKTIIDLQILDSVNALEWPNEMKKINAYLKNFRGKSDEILLMAEGQFLILDKNFKLIYQKDLSGHNSGNSLLFKLNSEKELMFSYMSDFQTGVRMETWSYYKWDKNKLKELTEKDWNESTSEIATKMTKGEHQLELAKKYYRKHDYKNAIETYKNILINDPNNATIYGLMGYSYFRNKQKLEAIDALQTSLKINPNEYMSYYNLALVYWNNNQSVDSINTLKNLYKLDSKYKPLVEGDIQFKHIINSPEYRNLSSADVLSVSTPDTQ